jgi:hypothetical protein
MRALAIAGALALLAGGCLQQTSERVSDTRCVAGASQPWRPTSGLEFTVEASASGPDCEHAVATLVVRNAQNEVMWADARPTAHVMTLAPARDRAAMQTALGEWLNSGNRTMATSSALPDWPANAAAPASGEFPFYPEPTYDRDGYMRLRESDAPLYCYVQGMESMACLALSVGGDIEKVGVQAFPG